MRYLFVGENRSHLAKKMQVTWKDGRLAAKQLFDALDAIGFSRSRCEFCNWFEGGKGIVRSWGGPIVAMGAKVQKALRADGIDFIPLIHPAARGAIRKKERYIQHVREMLSSYECEECGEMHVNEFSVTCRRCDFERESGDL